ncbi:MAG: glycosyltransferase [bacterium]
MNGTSISVITVCRNSHRDIQEAAVSVLPALGAKDEWVVQDGASTDGTVEFLRGIGDPRLRAESRSDGGIYDAMNRAAERAAGNFFLFLGADDRLKIHLDEVRGYLKNARAIYYGDVWRMNTGDRYAGVFDSAKLARTNICQQAIFYPKTAFDGREFDVHYTRQADWVFNMACFTDPSLKFEYVPLLMAEYAQGGASSIEMDEAFQRDYRRLLKKHFSFRQRWRPALLSALSDLCRALPGVPSPRQTPARSR